MTMTQFISFVKFKLEAELKRACPVDKGGLRLSIDVEIKNNTLTVYMLDYGLHVEYGTRPHIIRPKDKKVLRWNKKKGSVAYKKDDIFAMEVHHPGTQANPFIRNVFYHKLPHQTV